MKICANYDMDRSVVWILKKNNGAGWFFSEDHTIITHEDRKYRVENTPRQSL
jgi:hypothetical protein